MTMTSRSEHTCIVDEDGVQDQECAACDREVNCGIQRWTIDAPSSSQYEKDADGEWVEWDDVKALLWERDEARTEADTLREQLAAAERKIATREAEIRRLYAGMILGGGP